MVWNYSGDPGNSDKDAVRFLVGDTNSSDQQLQDEEILWLLTEQGSVYGAARETARALAAKYSRQVTKAVGDLRLELSNKAAQYRALVDDIDAAAATSTLVPVPFAGGISRDDKQTREDDTDRVPPRFLRGQFKRAGSEDLETPHGWRD